MQPGTSTLWARHTQGALFLEVRKGAKKKKKKAEHAKLDTTEPNDQKEKKIQFVCICLSILRKLLNSNLGAKYFNI